MSIATSRDVRVWKVSLAAFVVCLCASDNLGTRPRRPQVFEPSPEM